MKPIQLSLAAVVLLILFLQNAFAVPGSQTLSTDFTVSSALRDGADDKKNIWKGNMEVGGSLGLGYSSFSGFQMNAQPRVQYFVFDQISLGGVLQYYSSSRYRSIGAGPAATWYFWQSGRWATFFHQNFIFSNHTSYWLSADRKDAYRSKDHIGNTGLGLTYFVTPSTALGGTLNTSYRLNGGATFGNATTDLLGSLMVYF